MFLNGRNLLAPFQIYLNQIKTYPFMWMNVVSFWQLLGDNYDLLSKFAIALTLAICDIGFHEALSKNMDSSPPKTSSNYVLVFVDNTTVYAAMNARYTYPVLILFILLTTLNKKYIIYLISVLISDLFTYSLYLFNGPGLNTGIVVAVMVCYAIYTAKVFCGIKPETVCVVKSEKE